MRLLAAELRKVWGRRIFLVLLAALALLNLFLLWNAARPAEGALPAGAFRVMEQKMRGLSMDEKRELVAAEWARVEALNKLESIRLMEARGWNWDYGENPRVENAALFDQYGALYESGDYLEYGETLVEEYRFMTQIKYEFEQADGYEAFLDDIQSKAAGLAGISIFAGEGANGYDGRNIEATGKAYAGMRGVAISYTPQKGIVTATTFPYTDVVALFAMLLLASALVRQERDGGLLPLIRATPAGRGATAAAKLGALALSLLGVLVLLYGSNLLFCGGYYGLGDLTRSVQSVPALLRSTLKLNVLGYLGVYLLAKWGAAFVAGAWVMLAALLFRRPFAAYAAGLALPAASWLVRQLVPAAGHLNVLKYANLASLMTTHELLDSYRSLYWFGHPVPMPLVEGVAALVLAVGFVAAFVGVFARAQLLAARHSGGVPALPWARRARPARPGHVHSGKRQKAPGLLRQEAYKLLVMNGAGLVLVVLLAYGVVQGVRSESYIDPDEMYYRRYMIQLAGPLTQEKVDWLEAEKQRFAPLLKLKAKQQSGEIGEFEYNMAMGSYWGLEHEMDIFRDVITKLNSLSARPGAQMVYATGYPRLFGLSGNGDMVDTLTAALACALCFSGLFAMEKTTGMVRVLGTTPLGRSATAKRKLWLAAAASLAVTVAVSLPRWWQVLRDYGLSAPFAPLFSLDAFAAAPGFLSILGLAVLAQLARLVACFAMAAVTLLLSHKLGSALGALFCSSALFGLPLLLGMLGLPGAQWAGPYPLFHFGWMATSTPTLVAGLLLLALWAAVGLLCGLWLCDHFAAPRKSAA